MEQILQLYYRRINILQKGQESNCLHNKMPNMKDLY